MAQPRYDEDADETRHGATDEDACRNMENRQNWKLKRIEQTKDSILLADCVFDGYCEFPPSYMDLTQGDYGKEEDDA